MTMDPVTHVEDVHKPHASVKTYLIIAAVLTGVTILELCVPYLPRSVMPVWLGIALLAILSIFKFAMVVMFFMHLYFDSRLMTFLFCTGLVMAMGTLISTHAMMSIHNIGPAKREALSTAKMLPPDATRGKAVFMTSGCGACHRLADANAVGTVGPPLDGIAALAGTRKPGMDARAYIDESIVSPDAYIVQGFPGPPSPMPKSFRGPVGTMGDQEYVDLLAYLLSLGAKK